MNILGSIASMAGGTTSNAATLLPALLEQLKKYPGGIAGLIAAFQQGGLGGIVSSWVATGPNEQVSVEQLRSVLDPTMVNEMAKTAGVDNHAVLQDLTSLLPLVIDKLSPDGSLKDEELDAGELTGMLSKMFGRFQ